jgi:hypothetical protein
LDERREAERQVIKKLAEEEFDKRRFDHIRAITANELSLDESDPFLRSGRLPILSRDKTRYIISNNYNKFEWLSDFLPATKLNAVHYAVGADPVIPSPELPRSQFPRPAYDSISDSLLRGAYLGSLAAFGYISRPFIAWVFFHLIADGYENDPLGLYPSLPLPTLKREFAAQRLATQFLHQHKQRLPAPSKPLFPDLSSVIPLLDSK